MRISTREEMEQEEEPIRREAQRSQMLRMISMVPIVHFVLVPIAVLMMMMLQALQISLKSGVVRTLIEMLEMRR